MTRSSSNRIAGYPTREVVLPIAGRVLTMLVVDELERYVDTAALLRDPAAPEPPYWAHLWPGSRALAHLAATEIECVGVRVIEVGCGLGLAGIVAATRGAHVTLIDTMSAALCFARANAARNGCGVNVVQTDVGRPGLRGQFDCCLAADVTYDPQLHVAVADFLCVHIEPGGRAWCTESVRTNDRGFRRACEARGLRVSERDAREVDEGRPVTVRITHVHR